MSRRLVPLLPRPGAEDAPAELTETPELITTSISPKRTSVRAACATCRQRKIRCTGERPTCGSCQRRRIACKYVTLASESHLMAQTRRYKAFEDLYEVIGKSRDEDAGLFIKRIQSGQDVESVMRSMEEGDLLLQLTLRPEWRISYDFPGRFGPIPPHLDGWPNPYLKSNLFGGSPFSKTIEAQHTDLMLIGDKDKIYAMPYHAARLVDARLEAIDLTRYTSVSSDKSLLRSLIAIYILYEYPWNSFFHVDFFLDDIVRGHNRYCSPLLVNAVLAASWHGYASAKGRADFWRPDNLGYRFLAEAKRLLELEWNEPSLTTVQAVGVISVVCTVNGVNVLAWQYMHKAMELGRRINLFNPNPRHQGKDHIAMVTTAWDFFNWQCWVCYHNFQLPLMKEPPPYALPTRDDATSYFGEIFVQYPESESRIAISHGVMHHCICEFRVIMNHIGARMFDNTDKPPSLSLEDTYKARDILQSWYENLPEDMSPLNIVMPSHLLLHIQYHVLLISIFGPHEHVGTPNFADSPRDIIGVAKACFETLLRIYYMRHGFGTYDYALLEYLPLLAFSSLRDAENASPGIQLEGRQTTQLLCAKGLYDQGKNMLMCRAIFSQFREALKDPGMQRELSQFVNDSPDLGKMLQELQSNWPIGQFNISDGDEDFSFMPFLRWAGRSQEDGNAGLRVGGESHSLSNVLELEN